MTKSINIKIPLSIAKLMDDNGELNPGFITSFIIDNQDKDLPNEPITEFTFNYTCKIDNNVHKTIKLQAINHDLPMNEYLGRLLSKYYN